MKTPTRKRAVGIAVGRSFTGSFRSSTLEHPRGKRLMTQCTIPRVRIALPASAGKPELSPEIFVPNPKIPGYA
jgi:hypothetical protein